MKSTKLKGQDFSKLFSSLPGFFLVVDMEFTIIAATKQYLDAVQNTHGNVVGKHVIEILPIAVPFIESVCTDKITRTEFFAMGGANVGVQFTPVIDEVGHVDNIILKIENIPGDSNLGQPDVSAGQNGESFELFAKLFNLNPAALAISRIRDSKIIAVNESFLRLFEFSGRNEVIGKTSAELNLLVQPEQRQEILALLNETVESVTVEGNIRTISGNIKWVAISIMKSNLSGESCLIATLIDITARKIAEDEIRSINADLEKTVVERTKNALETELEYRSVVEQATDGIFISDSNGNYIDVNSSACALLGYTKDELLKMNIVAVLSPQENATPPKFAELRSGRTLLTTRSFLRKDGSSFPVEISARMLSNGKMLGIVRDITERKRAEEAIHNLNAQLEEKVLLRTAELEKKVTELQESEEKFQKAFYASSAGLTITRLSDSTYVDVNDAFLKMIGYAREEVINRTALDLSLVVNIKKREEVLKAVHEHGAASHVEMTIRKKSGMYFDILSSIETITHHGERYAINIIYDITERKRAQEKLEAVNKELESFSYSVSHDLRAPLRSIMGYAEILQLDFSDELNETMSSHLHRITNSAKKMGRLIDDLLEFSRLGKLELAKTNIDTRKIVEKNVADLGLSNGKPQFIIKDLLPSNADFAMLNQVWFNLISNAAKYSAKKSHPVIEIGSYAASDRETVFYVKDNGAGFNMAFAGKLFGVFQRLHRPADFEGTGVGLALVKRIIDKHDGRIWAEAVEQEGATFFFSLPNIIAKS
jgi:PAS domain S-box-containing protein